MATVRRTRTGCLTCRGRKLKCTEESPVCAQCLKANRECLPASGVTFRHQQNPSMNGNKQGQASLKNFYGYRETFAKATTWVDVPKDLTFVHTNNPYHDEEQARYPDEGDTSLFTVAGEDAARIAAARNQEDYDLATQLAQATYPAYATQGLEALSAVASRDQYSYAPPPAPMGQEQSPQQQQQSETSPPVVQAPTNGNNLDFILNPTTVNSNIDPQLHSVPAGQVPSMSNEPRETSGEQVRTASSSHLGRPSLRGAKGPDQRVTDRGAAIESPGIAFLLRDYAERSGFWMDLNDQSMYFATAVPVLAVTSSLLLYSCIALSAKSLARTGGRRPVMGGQIESARRSKLESWPGATMNDEHFHTNAREYYDLAISLLREALSDAVRPLTISHHEHASPSSISSAQGRPLPPTGSDGLVAATVILCVYEFLDASTPEWSRHLDGAKSLFEIANDRVVHLSLPSSPLMARKPGSRPSSNAEPHRYPLNPGRRAVFWCFARQDMLSAFINVAHTRLDTFDLGLWRSAGLKITDEGYVCPSCPQHPDYHLDNATTDDMVSNALVWLLAKVVNFIAAGDVVPNEVSPLGLGMRQEDLLDYWHKLDAQLQAWHDGLPDSFHPTAMHRANSDTEMDEVWYPRPMCASSAQWWHFARIQLLHNKPHVTTAAPLRSRVGAVAGTSLAARHASYNEILTKSREHAKHIVAVGLGRSVEAARVNSVQPLWTAGLVLGASADEQVSKQTWMWRRAVVSLLRGIEYDLGWATEYRVQSLLELWGLPSNWPEDNSA